MISLGCARTLVDSEHVVNELRQVGFDLVAEGSGERVVVLNTCSFIQSAIDETESNIRGLIERKQRGEIQYVAVIGCYPSRLKPEERMTLFPEVDIWLTTKEESSLKQSLARLVFKSRFQPSVPVRYTKLTPSHYAYLKISEGCDHWCSFCTIPKIRGAHRSFSIETVRAEAMKQVAFGVRELIVVAEDTTAWGEDLYGKPSLPLLLDALADIPGLDWIRLMYIFPNRVDTAFIQAMNRHDRIIPYLDMPIQHCDTRLLGLMNRKYTGDTLRRVLDQLLEQVPGLVLRTSLIAGFPTETDEDFQSLQTFITQYPFAHLGCFAYSEEKETRSSKLTPKLPAAVIADRMEALMTTQAALVVKRNQSLIGTSLEMVMEAGGGRSYREAPDVDGCLKPIDATGLKMGDVVPVTVIGVDGVDLLVEVNRNQVNNGRIQGQ